ncbi:MAG: four helix bundle protein [Myxococcota bacterium]
MEPVTLWVIQRVDHFPRKHKFTIGDRWIDTCLDVQTSLVEATYIRDKRALLLSASRALVRARVLARVAASLHCISLDQEAHFNRETTEIGRMIGGWLRSLAHRHRNQDVAARAPS